MSPGKFQGNLPLTIPPLQGNLLLIVLMILFLISLPLKSNVLFFVLRILLVISLLLPLLILVLLMLILIQRNLVLFVLILPLMIRSGITHGITLASPSEEITTSAGATAYEAIQPPF